MKAPRNLLFLVLFLTLNHLSGQSVLGQEVQLEKTSYTVSELLNSIRDQGVNLGFSSDLMPDEKIAIKKGTRRLENVLRKLRDEIGIK